MVDEFVSGLPHTDINGALDVSEHNRAGVEKLKLPTSTVKSRIKMSIGITMVKTDDSLPEAFKRGDQALYQPRQGGRNSIKVSKFYSKRFQFR